MACWPMGLAGLAGRASACGASWVGPLARPNPVGKIFFFSNLFLMQKQIPEKSRNCVKARKIL
jgi:hypothetical protein